jgi:uncharacterized alpha-E superfamily protein
MMDLPKDVEMGWLQLVKINATEPVFYEKYAVGNEENVTRFLLADASYSGSLFSSLIAARENIRTSRDLLPDEAWEQVNEMYLYAKNNLDTVANRRHRVLFLNEILKGCQRFTGLLSGYMSHNNPYLFINLGRYLERADMTTRILDLASLLLSESRSNELRQYESILWINILKSLSALLMYRQHVRSRVNGDDVLNYLLLNENLPRAVGCCIRELADCINKLPNNDGLPDKLITLKNELQNIDIQQTTQMELREILDDLQNKFGDLHAHIAENWFLRFGMGQSQAQSSSAR